MHGREKYFYYRYQSKAFAQRYRALDLRLLMRESMRRLTLFLYYFASEIASNTKQLPVNSVYSYISYRDTN